jgi:CubicO group peptidase (beta-lactamase class C family)
MNRSGDWVGYVQDQPLVSVPGTHFNYCSGLSVLLGDILARHAGDVGQFAETHLFGPLGIDAYEWMLIRDGRHQTGGGLSLCMRDMARVGQLMLQAGRWNDHQVVSADWVKQCLKVDMFRPCTRRRRQPPLVAVPDLRIQDLARIIHLACSRMPSHSWTIM